MARMRRIATALTAAAGFSLAFCASAAAPPPIVESQPLGGVRPAQSPGAASTGATAGLEERLARIERQLDSGTLLEMLTRIEALQREVQELRGAVELHGHRMGGIEQRQREIYVDVDRRMRQLESAGEGREAVPAAPPSNGDGETGAAPSPGARAPVGTAMTSTVAAVAGGGAAAGGATGQMAVAMPGQTDDPRAEREAYERAFDVIRAGRYDEAIAAFRGFLSRYPSGAYSANAQYWLGEANYVTRRFDEAATEFGKVMQFYPDSAKAADALLKLGFSQYELQNWDDARRTLDRVVAEFPDTTARQLAEGRLQRMRMEGR